MRTFDTGEREIIMTLIDAAEQSPKELSSYFDSDSRGTDLNVNEVRASGLTLFEYACLQISPNALLVLLKYTNVDPLTSINEVTPLMLVLGRPDFCLEAVEIIVSNHMRAGTGQIEQAAMQALDAKIKKLDPSAAELYAKSKALYEKAGRYNDMIKRASISAATSSVTVVPTVVAATAASSTSSSSAAVTSTAANEQDKRSKRALVVSLAGGRGERADTTMAAVPKHQRKSTPRPR